MQSVDCVANLRIAVQSLDPRYAPDNPRIVLIRGLRMTNIHLAVVELLILDCPLTICTCRYDNKGCGRSYLSQRDLEAHIAYRHKEKSSSAITSLSTGSNIPQISLPPFFAPPSTRDIPANGLPVSPTANFTSTNNSSLLSFASCLLSLVLFFVRFRGDEILATVHVHVI